MSVHARPTLIQGPTGVPGAVPGATVEPVDRGAVGEDQSALLDDEVFDDAVRRRGARPEIGSLARAGVPVVDDARIRQR